MVLEFVRKHLEFMGILFPPGLQHAMRFLYIHNGFVFISLAIFTIPTFCYCIFETNTFSQLVNSFFFTLCGTLGISFQTVLLYGKSSVNQLIIDISEIFHRRCTLSLFNHKFVFINENLF